MRLKVNYCWFWFFSAWEKTIVPLYIKALQKEKKIDRAEIKRLPKEEYEKDRE